MPQAFPPQPSAPIKGEHGDYKIIEYLDKGGRGSVFLATSSDGDQVVIKFPSVDCDCYSERDIQKHLGEVQDSFQNEYRASQLLNGVKTVAHTIDHGTKEFSLLRTDGTATSGFLLPFIVQELVVGQTLVGYCEKFHSVPDDEFLGIREYDDWLNIFQRILEALLEPHSLHCTHGDLWPPNIMVEHSGAIRVVDWGHAVNTSLVLDSSGMLSSHQPFQAPERVKDANLQNWYAPADVYSACAVGFWLATGLAPPSPFKTKSRDELKSKTALKQEITSQISERNPPVLADNPELPSLLLFGMRPKLNERAKSIREVLAEIGRFQVTLDRESRAADVESVKVVSLAITKELERTTAAKAYSPLFINILHEEIRQILSQLPGYTSAVLEKLGSRDSLLGMLRCALSLLKPGDSCKLLTTDLFWCRENFGPDGRLLASLRLLADKCDVTIEIGLLLQGRRGAAASPDRAELIEALHRTASEFPLNASANYLGGFDVWICNLSKEQIIDFRRSKHAFILVECDDRQTLLAADYDQNQGRIVGLRAWDSPGKRNELMSNYIEYRSNSMSIQDYVVGQKDRLRKKKKGRAKHNTK